MSGLDPTFKPFNKGSESWTNAETADNFQYQFFPVIRGIVRFQVKANNDARLALTTGLQEAGPMYEVVLGGSNNTISTITKNNTKPNKVEKNTPKLLNKSEYRGFWISWNDGAITVGHEGQPGPFIGWTDLDPLDICFLGVSTGYGSRGSWKVEDIETIFTEARYYFFPVSNGKFEFKVRASENTAQVMLSHDYSTWDPTYEVIIGYNSKLSAIRKNEVLQIEVSTEDYLSADEFRSFWIRWNSVTIDVGRGNDEEPFMSWSDPNPFPIYCYGIYTSLGTGIWKIKGLPGAPQTNPPADIGTWVDIKDLQVPLGAVEGGKDSAGAPTYVARTVQNNVEIPYEYITSRGYVSENEEQPNVKRQVLVRTPSDNWVSTSGSNIPAGALPGGEMADGEDLYIGRVHYAGSIIIGYVQRSRGVCCVTIDGKEVPFTRYEVLMS